MTDTQAAEKTRQQAFEATLKRITAIWAPVGTPKDLEEPCPDMHKELEAARQRLDDTWLAARNSDLVTGEEFKAALTAWEEANNQAVTLLQAVR